MILSQTAVYAIKAVMHLAEQKGADPVRVDDIAKALGVPRNYLSKILHVLAREGILDSTRGPRGGFVLIGAPQDLLLSDVIRHFDPIIDSSGCLLGRERCSDSNPCAAHLRWQDASKAVRSFLTETTVRDLSGDGPGLEGITAGAAGGSA